MLTLLIESDKVMLPNQISQDTVTVGYNGRLYVYSKNQPEYKEVVSFIKNNDEEALISYLDSFRKSVEDTYNGKFRVDNEVVFIKNAEGVEDSLPKTLGDRLVLFAKEGLPYEPILKFWEKLRENPGYDTIHRLFDHLDKNHHPLTCTGNYIAWKKVRRHADGKLYDIYTGKFSNNPGDKPKVSRNSVDDDHRVECSFGLHHASWDYAKNHYGNHDDIMIEVEVDPRDVVSIPYDYDSQKIRCTTYKVLQVCEAEDTSLLR